MRKLLIPILLSFVLGACATLAPVNVNSTVSRNTILGIESGYGIVLTAELTYKRLCAEGSIPTTCRDVVLRLQAADRKAIQAISSAAKFIEAYPTVDASNLISAAKAALDNIRTILGSTGVV